jgi:hypothetical protein
MVERIPALNFLNEKNMRQLSLNEKSFECSPRLVSQDRFSY